MQASPLRLAHGWTLSRSSGLSQALVCEFIRPAVRAVPSSMARRFGFCRISLPADAELRAYWVLLYDEISMGIEGEIDEQALEEKRTLFKSRSHANRARRLARYGRFSFAGTAAEYVDSLWHEVTVRTGADYSPALPLRRRLELMARWFPPDRDHRLFPAVRRHARPSPSAPAW